MINTYGDNPSLIKLDDVLMDAISTGKLSPYQALALRIIKASVKEYLFFGLGPNHITPEFFLDAYDYLFKVRSNDSRSWEREFRGKEQEAKERCFDVQYNISGLDEYCPMDKFLTSLQARRTSIVSTYYATIVTYLAKVKEQEWKQLNKLEELKITYNISPEDTLRILKTPDNPQLLAQVLLYGCKEEPQQFKVAYSSLLF